MSTVESTFHRIGAQARRLSGTNAVIAGVCMAAIALMWVAVIAQARFERGEAVAAAIDRNSNLAVAFEEFSVRTIDGADAVANYVRREYGRSGAGIDIPGLIADGTIDAAAFAAISIVDERGNLVATSFERVPAVRSRRRIARTSPFTSRATPARCSSASRSSRGSPARPPFRSPAASTSPTAASAASCRCRSSRRVSPSSTATPRSARRTSSVWWGSTASRVRAGSGGRAAPAKTSRAGACWRSRPCIPTGTIIAPGRLDGVTRIYSYRTLRDYPLVVTVGVSEQDVLLPSSQRRGRNYLGARSSAW